MPTKYYAVNPKQSSISEGAVTFYVNTITLEVIGIGEYPDLVSKYEKLGLITSVNPRGGHAAPPKRVKKSETSASGGPVKAKPVLADLLDEKEEES
jgi:hypothetical protein